MLPEPELSVFIEAVADDARRVRIEARTPTGQALLQGLDAT